MKKILITGKNSYIGTSVETFLSQSEEYDVETVDMIDGTWKERSFSGYDVVFHVAGIAHIKETRENSDLYYSVNRDLALQTAQKAKEDGVKHFIFLSTMSVYGIETGRITKQTLPSPKNSYGRSKLQAEEGLLQLADENFVVSLVRPPMVYGKNCRGNFNSLKSLALKLPAFPAVENARSMIYIDNLSAFIQLLIDRRVGGLFFPQNRRPVSTLRMAEIIAACCGKKLRKSRLLGFGVKLLGFVPAAKKGFGSLVYEETEDFDYAYCVCDFEESVKKSV